MLPGYPDGSYGYARVNALLGGRWRRPGSHVSIVEYVGQGDSDKPSDYPYSTIERADLVEAQWQAHGVRRTFVVTFDYSSLVLLELLARQLERLARGEPLSHPHRICVDRQRGIVCRCALSSLAHDATAEDATWRAQYAAGAALPGALQEHHAQCQTVCS